MKHVRITTHTVVMVQHTVRCNKDEIMSPQSEDVKEDLNLEERNKKTQSMYHW